jgi:hypothetical protein
MVTFARRLVAAGLVSVALLSTLAGTVSAFVAPHGHGGMACCDEPNDCAARFSAVSCCEPGQLPDGTVPAPLALSVSLAKVTPDLPAATPASSLGALSSVACDAFERCCLSIAHEPPYLLHSVLLI